MLLKKRIVGLFEESIINQMVKFRQTKGVQSNLFWRSLNSKSGINKKQVIEPIRLGTPIELFKKYDVFLNSRFEMLLNLAEELNELHSMKLNFIKNNYGAFHNDIKLPNILINSSGSKLRAEFCDFGGGAGSLITNTTSTGYTPPEYHTRPMNQSISEACQRAQKKDIWSLGLVFLSFLIGKTEEAIYIKEDKNMIAEIAPLPLLKKGLENHKGDECSIFLSQDLLNEDIDDLREQLLRSHQDDKIIINGCFEIVKKMLTINIDQRISAKELLKEISELKLQNQREKEQCTSPLISEIDWKNKLVKENFIRHFNEIKKEVMKNLLADEKKIKKETKPSNNAIRLFFDNIFSSLQEKIKEETQGETILKIKMLKWVNPTEIPSTSEKVDTLTINTNFVDREEILILGKCEFRLNKPMCSEIFNKLKEEIPSDHSFALIYDVEIHPNHSNTNNLLSDNHSNHFSERMMQAIPGDLCGDSDGKKIYKKIEELSLNFPTDWTEEATKNSFIYKKWKVGTKIEGEYIDSIELKDKNELVLKNPGTFKCFDIKTREK